MKRLGILFLLGAMLFSVNAAYADPYNCCPQYCDSCEPCDDWEFYGEWLYWRARRCQLDFAINGNPGTVAPIGRVYSVDPSYDSGFRVGVLRECCDCLFGANYTYFRNSESNTVVDLAGLSGTHVIDIPGDVAEWNISFDEANFLASFDFCKNHCYETFFFGGFKLACINQQLESFYSASLNF